MRRTIPAVLALVLVASTLAAAPVLGQEASDTESNGTAPGAQFAGAVGVQGAELNGDVQTRAYGVALDRANSSDARAAVVAERLNATEKRLADLEARQQALDRARENGSMGEAVYRARVAELYAEGQTVQRVLDRSNATVRELPAEARASRGLDAAAVQTLSQRASDLTGPETAAIARDVAGRSAGQSMAPPANATDRAGGESTRGPGTPPVGRTRPDNTSSAGSDAGATARGGNAGA